MIQKRLYLSDQQALALRRRAEALGITEAELIRQALDALLRDAEEASRQGQLDELIGNTRRLAQRHRVPAGYRFRRAALYEERERRRGGRPA